MKRFLGFLAMLCFFLATHAQENTGKRNTILKPLKVGDQVPDLLLASILNNDDHVVHIHDFKGQLLIIDFWATSCGGCIEALRRMDSLARLFNGRLQILPVTAEKSARIKIFQTKNGYLKGWKFRTVTDDTALHALFPHRLLPHEVWIDGGGKVLGFTEATDVNAITIKQVLAGGGLGPKSKKDVLDYNRHKPLLVAGNGGSDTLYRYRSVITGMLPGLPSAMGFSYDSVKHLTVVRATNVSIKRLYALAYKGLTNLAEDQMDLGNRTGLYCYELDLPGTSPGLVRKSIREDLDRFFGVRSEFSGKAFRLLPPSDGNEEGPLTL
ncbi:TlpA family protein disulfide reductase [Mucilaginibacter ginsenosidivorax]|nr:TlpA disulfide reductase family protein [Mucilaginibacter ginsenosidivorax]